MKIRNTNHFRNVAIFIYKQVSSNKYGTFKPSKQIIKFRQNVSARGNNRDITKFVSQHFKIESWCEENMQSIHKTWAL